MIIQIPFMGFYDSWCSRELDDVERREAENSCEDCADPVGLETSDYIDILFKHTDYHAAHEAVAKKYVVAFNDRVKAEFELDLGLTWESMKSPREYNFTTDRIFCHITEEKAQELSDLVDTPSLRKTIRERFTSRDGFHSFYSNRVEDWQDKDLSEWDHNELGTLLEALIADEEDFEFSIFSSMTDTEVFYTAWSDAVDWPSVEQAVKEKLEPEEEDDGKFFPLGLTDITQYVTQYLSKNGLKA